MIRKLIPFTTTILGPTVSKENLVFTKRINQTKVKNATSATATKIKLHVVSVPGNSYRQS
jgi:hypothetical protein